MNRTFPLTSIIHDGKARTGVKIKCSICSREESLVMVGTASASAHWLPSKFEQKGWVVGKTARDDICPACREQSKLSRPAAKAATPPRSMSREDKRLIFGKIDSVYLDEKRGYETGWSDKRVADDLGVPLDWVRTLREDSFGPEGLSSATRESIALIAGLKSRVTLAEESIADITKKTAQLVDELAAIKPKADLASKIADELIKTYGRA